jgi:hypothetical protein
MRKALLICLSLLFAVGMAFGQKNLAVTNQSGDGNQGSIEQNGKLNQGYQDVDGDRNETRIWQYNNEHLATQDVGVGWAEDNQAFITQYGYKNAAHQMQRWDNSYASAYQEGDRNFINQVQIAPPEDGPGHTAYAMQFGRENEIYQEQRSTLPYFGFYPGNFADSYQDGYKNVAHVNQDGFGNEAYQRAYGAENLQVVDQDHRGHYALQYVEGTKNQAFTTQTGWDNNGVVEQFGSKNLTVQTQDGWFGFGPGNYAYSYQFGELNESYQTQAGRANVATSSQEGFNHVNIQDQMGYGNKTENIQKGW